ncbi:hypothetical protein IEQ34_008920 [Dendrobium chrysotoxum]|uniref:Uncharacterized protein n=1 Tax=Dendrobium chrysotoxum TaxID=161865 RepID=A0AAV7H1J1_DENCH|nr:hypothetical protein IEQ34_008920 [Dendrobium chrysotoxum]
MHVIEQSLGGHQTIHRKEIREMRQKHHDYMLTHHKRCAKKTISGARLITIATPCKDDHLGMIPLSPNRAFWKAQKKLKCGPKLHDFFGISNHWVNMSDREIDPNHLFLGAIDLDLKL